VEAFSRGTPVLAADIESTAELVKDGQTGLRFVAGDSNDLAAKAALLCADTAAYREMRRRCRSIYEERYTDKINYKLLMDIYRQAGVSTHARSA
jgi:glycosyltransferase involved in cell wall biosynthesis